MLMEGIMTHGALFDFDGDFLPNLGTAAPLRELLPGQFEFKSVYRLPLLPFFVK